MPVLETERSYTCKNLEGTEYTGRTNTKHHLYVVARGKKGLKNLAIYLCGMLWKISKPGV